MRAFGRAFFSRAFGAYRAFVIRGRVVPKRPLSVHQYQIGAREEGNERTDQRVRRQHNTVLPMNPRGIEIGAERDVATSTNSNRVTSKREQQRGSDHGTEWTT